MNICFDSNIAREYGINVAIILDKLYYWIEYNKANSKTFTMVDIGHTTLWMLGVS